MYEFTLQKAIKHFLNTLALFFFRKKFKFPQYLSSCKPYKLTTLSNYRHIRDIEVNRHERNIAALQ